MKLKPAKGFSLVELMTVIAIIGIVSVIAIPTFKKFNDNRNLKEAAGKIAGEVQLYKQRAIAENINYRINFNASANTYTIQKESALGSGVFNNQATSSVNAGYTDIVIFGTPSFGGGVTYASFNTRGTSTLGNLVLKHNKRLSTARIDISMMGRVRVTYALK